MKRRRQDRRNSPDRPSCLEGRSGVDPSCEFLVRRVAYLCTSAALAVAPGRASGTSVAPAIEVLLR